jgi:hypothetical protein
VPVPQELLVLYPAARALRRCAALEVWESVRCGLGVPVRLEVVERLGSEMLVGNTTVPDEALVREVGHGCDVGA